MKEINIEEQKQIQLNILSEVSSFCEKHGLNYFLAYGTLIGAVRHQGYIPWDDDIDIWMPEPDYDKFIRTFNSDNYKVIHNRNSRNYYVNFAKVHDERTRYQEPYTHDTGFGVFIDVFPLHAYSGSFQRSVCFLFYRMIRMKRNKWYKNKPLYKNIINKIGHFCLLPIPLCFVSKCLEFFSRLGKWEEAKYVHSFSGNASEYPKSCFDNYEKMKFESLECRIPIGYDIILTLQYGEYMKLPEENKRILKHNAKVWRI